MNFDLKNILVGFAIGMLGTASFFLIVGEVDIQTDFQFGERSDKNDKDIIISIEKFFNESGEEIIIVDAIGKGSVTMEDIEKELEKVFIKKKIDASSGLEVNITLDDGSNFK